MRVQTIWLPVSQFILQTKLLILLTVMQNGRNYKDCKIVTCRNFRLDIFTVLNAWLDDSKFNLRPYDQKNFY